VPRISRYPYTYLHFTETVRLLSRYRTLRHKLTEVIHSAVRGNVLLAKMPASSRVAPEQMHVILLLGLRGLRGTGLLSNNVSHTNLPLGKFVNLLRRTRESGSAPRTENGPCIRICGHGRTAKETLHLRLHTGLLV